MQTTAYALQIFPLLRDFLQTSLDFPTEFPRALLRFILGKLNFIKEKALVVRKYGNTSYKM